MKFATILNIGLALIVIGVAIKFGFLWGLLVLFLATLVQVIAGWNELKAAYLLGQTKADEFRPTATHLWKVLKGDEEPTIYNEKQKKLQEAKADPDEVAKLDGLNAPGEKVEEVRK